MATIYGYGRVSTDEQARSGLGLEAQHESVRAGAAARGWTDLVWVSDDGVSGTVAPHDRPSLGWILERLQSEDVLIVAKLDRLGRSALDVLNLADRAQSQGWHLVVLDLGLDTTTPVGRFTLTTLAGVVQLERDLIAQRTRDALAAKRARGERLGRPVTLPQGVRARVARERSEGASLRQIAARLNDEGVPTAHGGTRWHASTVSKVCASIELDCDTERRRKARGCVA